MESIHKLEKTVAGWYKNVPHLPAGGQKWLADNVWWIVLVGLVLTVLAIFPMIAAVLFAGAVVGGLGAAYGGAYGAAGVALTGTLLLAAWVAIAFLLFEAILLGLAISPLKAHKKKGWDLLFILALINVLSVVVSGLIGFNLMSLIWGLLWAAVGAYFLFEIRGHFGEKAAHQPAAKKPEAKKAAKA